MQHSTIDLYNNNFPKSFNYKDPSLWPHNNHIDILERNDKILKNSIMKYDELMEWEESLKPPINNSLKTNNKNRVIKDESKEVEFNDKCLDMLKKQSENNNRSEMDGKDLEFVEDTNELFKLPIDFLQWNDKNIEDWFFWIRHKLRFKFPKMQKIVINVANENPVNTNIWIEKFGQEVGFVLHKEFSKWVKYKTIKTKSDTGRKHNGEYDKNNKPRRRNEKKDGLYLWQILLTMLSSEKCSYFITWTDYGQGTFKIKDPNAVSIIWGESKGNSHMTYDKMSRSMRQYYKSNLLKKTNHDKLNYCFNMDDSSVKKFIQRCSDKIPDIKIPQCLLQRPNS